MLKKSGTCEEDLAEDLETAPVSAQEFEAGLQKIAPFTWDSCHRFKPMSLIDELRAQSSPWISPDIIMQKDVCTWFDYLPDKRQFKCRLCSLLLKQGIIVETKGSKILTKVMTSGQGYSGTSWAKSANEKIIAKHKENPIHKIALEFFAIFDQNKRATDLVSEFERPGGLWRSHLNATENHFVNVLQSTRLDVPFDKYPLEVERLEYFGVNMGTHYHNGPGNKRILMSLSQSLHLDFVNDVKKERPVLSVMVDTSTDIASLASLAIVFHLFGQDTVVQVKLYGIIHASKGETGEALFELFRKALSDDGLEDYVKERCVGFSSDGGSNMKTFRRLLDSYTKQTLATVHCMAHRLELAIKKAWKGMQYLNEINQLVNTVNTMFNSRSAKKKLILAATTKELGSRPFETKRIIATRWMASKARALDNIFRNWKPIVVALDQIRVDRSFKADQRVKAAYAFEMLKDPVTISTIAFLADVCEVIAELSVKLQERGTSIIGKREKREMLQEALARLQTDDGTRLESLLKAAQIKTGEDAIVDVTSLDDFEEKPSTYQGVELVPSDADAPEKLSKNRVKYLEPIIEQIDEYYPEDTTDAFDILDPNSWAKATLDAYGEKELQELNTALLWNNDWNSLKVGWKNLKQSVYGHSEFQARKKGTAEQFWKYFLEDPLVLWSAEMKLIVKNILTVQSSTAEVERIYSMYTHTKTPQRYSLDVSTVEAIVRVRFNGPKKLEDFHPTKYAKRFIAEHSRADDEYRRATWKKRGRDEDEIGSSETTEIVSYEKNPRLDAAYEYNVLDDDMSLEDDS